MKTLQALTITPAARAWLGPGGRRRVLHVFDRTCNLVDDKNRILSLVLSDRSMGPFSLKVGDPAGAAPPRFHNWVDIDDPVSVQGTSVRIGVRDILTDDADLWSPAPDWRAVRAARPEFTPRLEELQRLLLTHAPADSFAPLTEALQQSDPGETSRALGDAVQAALEPAGHVIAGLQEGDLRKCRTGAAGLAGLGGGLTPSGDDFLVGAMHAVWAAKPAEDARRISGALQAPAAPRTTLLSAAWLASAAQGEVGWPWHWLFQALIDGTPLHAPTRRLTSLGHTSGADALSGFLLSLQAPID